MTERLANVVYWTASGVAAIWIAFVFYAVATATPPLWGWGLAIGLGIGGPVYLAGLAVRYVLKG